MFRKRIAAIVFSMILASAGLAFLPPAPECGWFIPLKRNISYEISTFNEKGKLITRSKYSYVKNDSSRTLNSVYLNISIKDRKRKPVHDYNFQAHCHRTGLLVESKALFPPDFSGALGEMHLVEEGDVIDFPAKMEVGDSLKGGYYQVVTYLDSNSQTPILRMTMLINKRHVAERKSIKIGLGTFDCFRIESEIRIISNGIPLSFRLEEYYNQEHGLIYSERFGWTGIRTGYSELTKMD